MTNDENTENITTEDRILTVKKLCTGLQSLDRKIRKQTYVDLQKYLSDKNIEFNNQDLRTIFIDIHIYVLNGLRDKTETVREQAIKFITYLVIDKLPLNDYYLTYILPVLVERVGTVELIEESEEIRLQIVELLNAIITR